MRRKGNHQFAMIRGSKRQCAVRDKHRRTTNIGAGTVRRAGRSRVMALDRGCATILVVLVPALMAVHVLGACSGGVSLGEQRERCGAMVMGRRHRDCRKGLPRQHQEQQHYREITCTHQHECKYNTGGSSTIGPRIGR